MGNMDNEENGLLLVPDAGNVNRVNLEPEDEENKGDAGVEK